MTLSPETARRQIRVWYLACGVVSLGLLSIPFLWRSSAFALVICLGPCAGLITLVLLTIFVAKSQLRFKHILIGLLLMSLSFYRGLTSDVFARDVIFRWNYPGYRALAAELLKSPPSASDGKDISRDRLRGFGIYSGSYEVVAGQTLITLRTGSGPTLESVLFSPEPVKRTGTQYELKRKDDLGYWYFTK